MLDLSPADAAFIEQQAAAAPALSPSLAARLGAIIRGGTR